MRISEVMSMLYPASFFAFSIAFSFISSLLFPVVFVPFLSVKTNVTYLEPVSYTHLDVYKRQAIQVAESVAKGEYDKGILICGTGIGVSIAANKVQGAYAVSYTHLDVYKRQIFPGRSQTSWKC